MLDFIRLLKQRYQSVLAQGLGDSEGSLQSNLNSLTLAEAFLEKGRLNAQQPRHAIQIAVIGPTQAGKSSIVNLLLGDTAAGVSALAGYTVHAQGFCLNTSRDDLSWVGDFFQGYERLAYDALPHDRPLCYALEQVPKQANHPLPPSVIWDTPDFDSIDASGYRDSVLRTAALADVILLAVSKDKYADQSVWDMMALLESLGHPTVICLNKLTPESKEMLLPSLQEKWQQSRSDTPFAITTLPYSYDGLSSLDLSSELQGLYRQLNDAITKKGRKQHGRQLAQLLQTHWQGWLAPVRAEQQLQQEWNHLVDAQVKDALLNYRREFLDHPEHYGTFQRAIAELLTLLEVPGFGAVMSKARRVITWPLKKIFGMKMAGRVSGPTVEDSKEMEVLSQLTRHLLIQSAEGVLLKMEQAPEQSQWWKSLGTALRSDKTELQEHFDQDMRQYYADFQPEVENAADRLYQRLEKHPAILNSLRVTRAGIDAAAVALLLHTGGIGLHDFIIAPAVLSLTSLLAESALGTYMDRVIDDLKRRQLSTVEQQLFTDSIKRRLYSIPEQLDNPNQFNISSTEVQAVESQLKEARYGLQLL